MVLSVRLPLKQLEQKLVYPAYLNMAEQILHKTGIHYGKCLIVSAGNGLLGLALAQISDLQLYLLENSQEALSRARKNIAKSANQNQLYLIKGSTYKLQFPSQSMDLVISRSSVFFQQNQVQSFQEIYRVLASSGVAYIGGGFWNGPASKTVKEIINAVDPKLMAKDVWRKSLASLKKKLDEADIGYYEINYSNEGLWIMIRKPVEQKKIF